MTAVSDAAQEPTIAERDMTGPQVDLFSNGWTAVLTPLLSALPLEASRMAAPTDPKFPFMSVLREPSEFWVVKPAAIFEWVHMVLRASPNLTDADWAQLRAVPNEMLAKVNSIIFKLRTNALEFKYARGLAADITDIYLALGGTHQDNLRRIVVQMLVLGGHARKAAKVLDGDHATMRKLIPWLLTINQVDPVVWSNVYLTLPQEPTRKPIRSLAAAQMATVLARTGMPKLTIEVYEKYGAVG
ncbi:hypothetical protein AMAG_10822 [Allomyces macrogynus ATCC 38327]|uniref:Uncharacterized protein n=1 Tax=Allomyces macrogynus (strain ATCC 38327) TaxID=578462 RepID=A0A0L0SS33_ALLM3|nr:hypothetical protein AMAG_10822 [Allomyces macrogynus ATCC 38327]|eukprot:KNE65169.1 hypothetical protein AMAG_10822 [Allomyces macrogynus ATCC 38327]